MPISATQTVFRINCKDSVQDVHTQVLAVLLTDFYIHLARNLHTQLKICEVARVMLTCNMDLEDCLINGSTGTVVHLQMSPAGNPLHGKMC